MYLKKFLITAIASSASLTTLCASAIPGIDLLDVFQGGGKWSITAEGNYLTQNNALPPFGEVQNVSLSNPGTDFLNYPTGNDWGWGVGIGYTFASNAHDVRFSYHTIRSDNSDTVLTTDNTSTTTTFFPAFGNPGDGGSVNARNQQDFQIYDLTVGNICAFTDRITGRFGYGISYVDIYQRGSATPTYPVVVYPLTATAYLENKSTFQGIGPKFTGDLDVKLFGGLSFIIGGGVSALFGESKAKVDALPNTVYTPPFEVDESKNSVAWGVESNAGFRYDYVINDKSAVNVEIGYKGTDIINAFQGGNVEDLSNFSYDTNYYNYGGYITVGVAFL